MNANAFSSRSSTIMSARVLVLGAAGRLGRTAAEAFRDAGWTVASLVRPGSAARAPADTEVVEVHALDHAAVGEAARGADVVLHALNPSYTDWPRLALPLAYSAITAAETAGATLLFPETLPPFASFGFPGHALTGREFTSAIAAATGSKLQVDRMTWWLIHALRPIVPLSRELSEIAYLWNEPHRIDGGKLEAAIGDIPRTPLDVAVARALEDLGAVA